MLAREVLFLMIGCEVMGDFWLIGGVFLVGWSGISG